MKEEEKLILLAELENADCELSHGPRDLEPHPAVDYITIPIGYKKNKVEEIAVRELTIPICIDCTNALARNEWTLIYCIDCCSSQWILRAISRLNYKDHILWVKGCPKCGGKFNGLYFTDEERIWSQF